MTLTVRQRARTVSAATLVLVGAAFALNGAALARPGQAQAISDSSAPAAGRPVVILVHGRGQLMGDTAAVRAEWSQVLLSGASRLASPAVLGDEDVRVAWYADALDPLAPVVCDAAPSSGATGNGARRDDEQLRAFFAAAGAGITAALDMIDGPARLEARALAGDLLFLGDPVRRCAAESRLESALSLAARQKRPVILVAHSFGSLIAYGYLQSASSSDSAAFDIHRFVTLGSLLGAPGARQLFLGDHEARASLPSGVRAWTNIVDVRDGLAHPILFDGDSTTARVDNVTTTPGSPGEDPHHVLRYLADPVTARVVLGAWCDAFEIESGQRLPAGCHALADSR
jgi:hypothetical protein